MPDGDKFERKLWGKVLKEAYRLACSNGELQELIRLLDNGKNYLLKNGLDCSVIDEIGAAVHRALNRPLFSQEENIRWLSQELDRVSFSQNDSHGTRLAVKGAKAVYAHEVESDRQMTLEQIKRLVRNKFTSELLDDQFFSRVREKIMKETKRSFEAQINWEKKLTEGVISYKRTRQSAQLWDREQLSQPLPVLEG